MSDDKPILNVELIRKTWAHIKAHPEAWDQNSWTDDANLCGTSHCFGGWAIVLSGDEVPRYGNQITYYDGTHLARPLLGLTDDQALDLFEAGFDDTLDEYEARITAVTGVTFA